ncbi:MAG: NAD-dependent epimerase/dehydratase family protein [Rhodospirillales bacterium]
MWCCWRQPACCTGAPYFRLCVVVFGLRQQPRHAVLGRGPLHSPVSLYGATKKAMEVIGESYTALYAHAAHRPALLHRLRAVGTTSAAYFSFTRKIVSGEPIPVFNHGDMRRDFTFIDDIVEGVPAKLPRPAPEGDEQAAPAPG